MIVWYKLFSAHTPLPLLVLCSAPRLFYFWLCINSLLDFAHDSRKPQFSDWLIERYESYLDYLGVLLYFSLDASFVASLFALLYVISLVLNCQHIASKKK